MAEDARSDGSASGDAGLQALLDAVPTVTVGYDPVTLAIVIANQAAVRAYGYTREELIGMPVTALRPPEDVPAFLRALAQSSPPVSHAGVWRHQRKDGSVLEVEIVVHEAVLSGRRLRIATCIDLTGERLAARARDVQHARLKTVLANAPIVLFAIDAGGTFTHSEGSGLAAAGLAPGQIVGMSSRDLYGKNEFIGYDGVKVSGLEVLERALRGIPYAGFSVVGGRTYDNRILPERDGAGRITGVIGVSTDVSEQRVTERALRASEELFRQLAENIREVFWVVDLDARRVLYVSPGYEAIWGRPREEVLSDGRAWLDSVHPEDRVRVARALDSQAAGGYDEVYRILRPDGSQRWIRDRGFRVEGPGQRVVGVADDITDLRRTEEERQQAQKMEAVGRLAGGIAHDFNNLLMVIQASADFLLESVDPSSPLLADLADIRQAGQRAATLTRQLLAFSRRQVLQPRSLDLNVVLAGIESMVRRLIGAHIQVVTDAGPGLGPVSADPGQLEQVIVNLAVNARDAMAQGGRLSFRTANVSVTSAGLPDGLAPGEWVMLAVSDTGVGMDERTRARIFEPFFTTKEAGRGTGLGLATVYGILQQSGGQIAVESEPGHGTTFRLYLPRQASGNPPGPSRSQGPDARAGGSETILVVEDEHAVRGLLRRILEAQGYRVMEAANGVAALAQQRLAPAIDLLITDTVMPEMGGLELYQQLRELRPGLPVLFISGYTDEMVRRGVGDRAFLQKPFSAAALAEAVRKIFDARARPGS